MEWTVVASQLSLRLETGLPIIFHANLEFRQSGSSDPWSHPSEEAVGEAREGKQRFHLPAMATPFSSARTRPVGLSFLGFLIRELDHPDRRGKKKPIFRRACESRLRSIVDSPLSLFVTLGIPVASSLTASASVLAIDSDG